MEDYNPGEEQTTTSEEQYTEDGEVSSSEEAFMKGYNDEDDVLECAECGSAIKEEKFAKEIDGEQHLFCSKLCEQEFEESLT